MANWKKIIVSGSQAHLAAVSASNLSINTLLIGGTGGLIQNSSLTLSGGALTGNSINAIFTGANSALTGSFTGSFSGDGSGLTGLATSLSMTDGTNTDTVDLVSDELTFTGGTSLTSTVSDNAVQFDVDAGGITETQLNTSVAGTGLAGGGGTALSVALSELAEATVDVSADSFVFLDADENFANVKDTIADLVAGIAGSNLSASSGQLSLSSTISGNHTFSNDLTISGDLTVDGTTTTLNTTNLLVEDRFILLNSGSANPDEGGLVIDEGSGTGHAFIYEADGGYN